MNTSNVTKFVLCIPSSDPYLPNLANLANLDQISIQWRHTHSRHLEVTKGLITNLANLIARSPGLKRFEIGGRWFPLATQFRGLKLSGDLPHLSLEHPGLSGVDFYAEQFHVILLHIKTLESFALYDTPIRHPDDK